MKIATVLWATRIGDPDWKEELITDNPKHIQQASKWAKENGFDRLRISKINLDEPPDFINTINM